MKVAYAENQSMFLDSLMGDGEWIARYALSRQAVPLHHPPPGIFKPGNCGEMQITEAYRVVMQAGQGVSLGAGGEVDPRHTAL